VSEWVRERAGRRFVAWRGVAHGAAVGLFVRHGWIDAIDGRDGWMDDLPARLIDACVSVAVAEAT